MHSSPSTIAENQKLNTETEYSGEEYLMKIESFHRSTIGLPAILALMVIGMADEPAAPPRAFLDGTGPGWKALGEDDFVAVNGNPETWTWKDGGVHCTGLPVGVTRTRKPLENFELVAQWRHLHSGGNSGIFVWAGDKSLEDLKPGSLPRGGIEVQILDHGYKDQYEKQIWKKGRLVHDSRRRLLRRNVEDDPVPAGLAQRPSQLPFEEPQQGCRPVEPLLRPVHQRRGPTLGQR